MREGNDYVFRGVTQFNHKPSVTAHFEPRYNVNYPIRCSSWLLQLVTGCDAPRRKSNVDRDSRRPFSNISQKLGESPPRKRRNLNLTEANADCIVIANFLTL
jgi:hypothetical protein